jgi:hypothetical protein
MESEVVTFLRTCLISILGILLLNAQISYDTIILDTLPNGMNYAPIESLECVNVTDFQTCDNLLNCMDTLASLDMPFVGEVRSNTTQYFLPSDYNWDLIFLIASIGLLFISAIPWTLRFLHEKKYNINLDSKHICYRRMLYYSWYISFWLSKFSIAIGQLSYCGFRIYKLPWSLTISLSLLLLSYLITLMFEAVLTVLKLSDLFTINNYEEVYY